MLYTLEEFEVFLEKVRGMDRNRRQSAAEADQFLRNQLIHFPFEETTFWGYQSWRKHPAKPLLRQDMDEGKLKEMKPSELRRTRPEYQTLNKEVFRHRIYQERKAVKQKNWNDHKMSKTKSCQVEMDEWSSSSVSEHNSDDSSDNE